MRYDKARVSVSTVTIILFFLTMRWRQIHDKRAEPQGD